jgi:4a-hydroxytetrahydrobiopterin dehydratase
MRNQEWMNIVAEECKKQKHHPEWSNVYNTAFVRWTTHAPAGLSAKDVLMARFCDEKALECGEVVGERGEGEAERELVKRVVGEGGNCCVPQGAKNAG